MRLCTDGCQNLTWAGDHYDGRADGHTEIGTRYWVKNWANSHITLKAITAKVLDGIHPGEGLFSATISPDGTSVVGGVMDWRIGDATGKTPFTLNWGKPLTDNAAPAQAAGVKSSDTAEQSNALNAAAAWLKILDSGDYKAACLGLAQEIQALITWPTDKENEQLKGLPYMVQVGGNRPAFTSKNLKVTRKLRPDSVNQVTAADCGCAIRIGNFYVMAYDVTYTWDMPDGHAHGMTEGIDLLYMVQEQDGTWKPAKIRYSVTASNASQPGR